jgi:putative addiction module component (TIGR02574 family)
MNTAILDEARRLSIDERIRLVSAIWDTVAEDAGVDVLPLSDEHRSLLEERLRDRSERPADECSWSEVIDRLRDRG